MIKKLGFTLIEILVVIAIIGLLASMILSSTKAARDKAKNARITQDVMEYAKALALYQSDNGGLFPQPTSGQGPGKVVCLGGGYTGGNCGLSNNPNLEDSGLNNLKERLNPYFPGGSSSLPPIGNNMQVSHTDDANYHTGALYKCSGPLGALDCTLSRIIVYLQGDVSCPRPANSISIFPDTLAVPGVNVCTINLQ